MRPRRSALRSPLSALRPSLVAIAIGIVAVGAPTLPLTAQQIPYATHDWTASMPASGPFHETWADVKTPGDGRQYAVGTITVQSTQSPTSFSGALVQIAGSLPFLAGPQHRQIVILQVTDAAQGIVWQRYYYGGSSTPGRACNARAISVWPGVTDAATLIAICGETYDQNLPNAQASYTSATATSPTGFIAVFSGDGTLRWSHHLFGQMLDRSCAITDVSVRVESDGVTPQDVVTYCGITTHEFGGAWLAPVKPFASFSGSSSGSTVQSPTSPQWDGFVGRVSRSVFAHTVEFHSSVSGPDQDGFFGLAEIDRNRFVVVGATELVGIAAPPPGFAFPGLTTVTGSHYLGVAMVFDALPTRTGGNLVLENVQFLGDLQSGSLAHTHTLVRDVVVRHDWLVPSPASQMLIVAGSTDSPTGLSLYARNNTFHGGTDGFVAGVWDDHRIPATPLLAPIAARYFGGAGKDGFVGVQGWNEYDDHVVATGFSEDAPGLAATDIVAASYFVDTFSVPSLDSSPSGRPESSAPQTSGRR